MRLLLLPLILGICWSAEISSQQRVPAESSFVIRLADEAIDADGVEAASDRESSRALFVSNFLDSFTQSVTSRPFDPSLYRSRIAYAGRQAGRTYRLTHPDSVERVMKEYGYERYEVVGEYTADWRKGYYFVPDHVKIRPVYSQTIACWNLRIVESKELDEQMKRLFSEDEMANGWRKRIKVIGYLGPLQNQAVGVSSTGLSCERILFASSVDEIAREAQ